MAVLPILTWPDKRLVTVCSQITCDVSQLAADMFETMYDAPGRGLAAPQIGQNLRMFVMDATWKQGIHAPQVFINPTVIWRSDKTVIGPEGCLSLPHLTADVRRATSITLAYTNLAGVAVEQTLTGFAAICAQHEYDHLEGILTLDHLSPADRNAAERAML